MGSGSETTGGWIRAKSPVRSGEPGYPSRVFSRTSKAAGSVVEVVLRAGYSDTQGVGRSPGVLIREAPVEMPLAGASHIRVLTCDRSGTRRGTATSRFS